MAFELPDFTTTRGWSGTCYAKVVKYIIWIDKNTVEVFFDIYKDAEASDAGYLPVERKKQLLSGDYFATIYGGEGDEPTETLQDIYNAVYESDNWWVDNNAEAVYEKMKIDREDHDLASDDYISRKTAVELELNEDVDFETVTEK